MKVHNILYPRIDHIGIISVSVMTGSSFQWRFLRARRIYVCERSAR